jgi:opacity protein-like surface antigen
VFITKRPVIEHHWSKTCTSQGMEPIIVTPNIRANWYASARPTAQLLALFLGFAGIMCAQNDEDGHHFTFNVGGGLTTITGRDAGKLDHGGNVQVGGGYFFNRYFGVTGNFQFNQLGITRSELNLLNQPDGNARVYSVTADPTLRLPLGGGANVYVLAGGGYLRRTVEFTQPTLAQTFIFDPWWGFFGSALVPVNQVLGTVRSDSGAYNVGGGINVPLPITKLHFYIEARYLHGFTSNSNTTVVPIIFGIRR